MLISYSHKFLFVHVWKVAGTSIRESLRPFSHDPLHTLVKSLGSLSAYLEWLAQHDKRQQQDFLVDERGRLLVDFVGRFERLEVDFREVCQRLSIGAELKS